MVSVWPGSGTYIGSKLTGPPTESYDQMVAPRLSTLGITTPSIFTSMAPLVRSGAEVRKKLVRNPKAVLPRFSSALDQSGVQMSSLTPLVAETMAAYSPDSKAPQEPPLVPKPAMALKVNIVLRLKPLM